MNGLMLWAGILTTMLGCIGLGYIAGARRS